MNNRRVFPMVLAAAFAGLPNYSRAYFPNDARDAIAAENATLLARIDEKSSGLLILGDPAIVVTAAHVVRGKSRVEISCAKLGNLTARRGLLDPNNDLVTFNNSFISFNCINCSTTISRFKTFDSSSCEYLNTFIFCFFSKTIN